MKFFFTETLCGEVLKTDFLGNKRDLLIIFLFSKLFLPSPNYTALDLLNYDELLDVAVGYLTEVVD
jgi:hypothetical protein